MNVNFELAVNRRGFFPKGAGEISLRVPAAPKGYKIEPIHMTKRGSIVGVHAWVFVGGRMPRHVGDKLLTTARDTIREGLTSRGLSECGL